MSNVFSAVLRRVGTPLRGETAIVTGSFVLINLIRILSTIILTRLLAPDVFGVIGILTSIAFAVAMVSDVGFQAFVIRHERGDEKHLRNVVWTLRLARSVILTILLFVLAGPIATLIAKPELVFPIELFSLYFLLEGLTSLALVSAYRNRQLVRLNTVEIAAGLTQLVVSVLLAIPFPSYWAILAAMLVSSSVKIALSYALFPDSKQSLAFNAHDAKELLGFARFVMGSSVITLLISQTDKLVLSRLFSLEDFGLYVIAASLAQVPVAFANSYGNQILLTRYSATWRDAPAAMRDVYYSTKRAMHGLYVLGVGVTVGLAPSIIELLYDDRYRPAALFLSILAAGSLLSMTNLAAAHVLTASGRFGSMFKMNVARLAWLVVAAPVAWVYYGTVGLIAAFASIELAGALYQWAALRPLGLLRVREEVALVVLGFFGIGTGMVLNLAFLPIIRLLA